jgi:hypothetical protein
MNLREATEHTRSVVLAELVVEVEAPAPSNRRNPGIATEKTPDDSSSNAPRPAAPSFGKLSVNVRGTWGNLVIDGTPKGTTPFTGKLKAGPHKVRVYNEAAGFDLTQKVVVKRGETEVLAFTP